MLGSIDRCVTERRSWREVISICLVCSLGVSVVGWADEKEPIRVAARSQSKAAIHERSSFSRPTGKPWKKLGESQGYTMFRLGELSQHKAFKKEFGAIEKSVLRNAADAKIGLRLANIELIQTNAFMSINEIPNESRKGPQTQSLNLGANSFDVKCSTQVDWPQAVEEIHIPAFGPEESEATQWILKKMKENGVSKTFRLESKKENDIQSIRNEQVKQLWNYVDGGTVAITVAIPDNLDESRMREEKDPYQVLAWYKAIQAVAVGIDLYASKSGRPQVRFALSPKTECGAKELAKLIEVTKSLIVSSKSFPDEEMDDDQKNDWMTILEDFSRWEISVRQPTEKEGQPFVALEGDLTLIPMFLF